MHRGLGFAAVGDKLLSLEDTALKDLEAELEIQLLGCFLTCIQVSQDADKVVWYSHLLKNFPQFVVIHTVKALA